MPSFTFECETRTPEQVRRFQSLLAALRLDPQVAHIECSDDNPLTPYATRVEVSCADGLNGTTMEILRCMGAEGVPAVRLDSLGFPSYWAPMQVSHLDIRDVRPVGAPIPRHEEPGFLERMAERGRLDREARLRLRIPDFQVRDDQAFRQEYQGTFHSASPEGGFLQTLEALQQGLQRNPADVIANNAIQGVQEDFDQDILDTMRRQDEVARLQPMPLTIPDDGLEFRLNAHARYGAVHDDRVDALSYAADFMGNREAPPVGTAGFTRLPMTGFSRLQPEFGHGEYQALGAGIQPMQSASSPTLGPPIPRPPERTPEPEVHRRTRFERIDDD